MGLGWAVFTDALHENTLRDHLNHGVAAWIELYYRTNSDANMLDPEALGALQAFMSHVDADTEELIELIRLTEKMINENGGVTSHSDGTRHLVATYSPDGELLPYALATDANTTPAP